MSGRYFPFEADVDGRRYRGEWTLRLGDRICVTCSWGTETVELKGTRPESCAKIVLERIIRAHLKKLADEQRRRERELQQAERRNARRRARDDAGAER